jgi:hypothetical protein
MEADKVTVQVWREHEFEDRAFDVGMLTAAGTASSIIEGEPYLPFWKQRHADMVYVGPEGKHVTIEVKVNPRTIHEYLVWRSLLRSPYSSNRENLINAYRHASELLNQSTIVLSCSLIDELSSNIGLWENVSASYARLREEDEFSTLEAVHPLTRYVYGQLDAVPTGTKEAIQGVLQQFARSISHTPTAKLPPLGLAFLEDSAYLVEWTFADRRLGFSFEGNPKDSGWYFVFSNGSSERYESGTMDQLEMGRLIGMTLKP